MHIKRMKSSGEVKGGEKRTERKNKWRDRQEGEGKENWKEIDREGERESPFVLRLTAASVGGKHSKQKVSLNSSTVID